MTFNSLAENICNEFNCGIYKITCLKNNKFYIGSSSDIKRRFKSHVRGLNNKNHHNIKLQSSWNKYGEDFFKYEVLIICSRSNLLMYEQLLVDNLKSVDNGFNISLAVNSPMMGRSHTKLSRDKISAYQNIKVISDETKLLMKKASKFRYDRSSDVIKLKWKQRSLEIINKIAISNTGKKRSVESCKNIGNATKIKWESAGFREKITKSWESRRKIGVSEITKEKLKDKMLLRWQDPIYIEKMSKVHIGKKRSAETIERMRISALARELKKRNKTN